MRTLDDVPFLRAAFSWRNRSSSALSSSSDMVAPLFSGCAILSRLARCWNGHCAPRRRHPLTLVLRNLFQNEDRKIAVRGVIGLSHLEFRLADRPYVLTTEADQIFGLTLVDD